MKRNRMPVLLLLVCLVGINAETLDTLDKPSLKIMGHVGLEPSRAAIYRRLLTEQGLVKGAAEHIKKVFDGLVANVHELIETSVLPNLQSQIDDVVVHAEEIWVNAGYAMQTTEVRTCIEDSEADAQKVAKRAVEKIRGCAEALQQEGERRVREATRLLKQIDAVTKRFIGALETCVRDAQTAELADDTTEASDPHPEPTPSSVAEESSGTVVEDTATAATDTKEEGGQAKEKCRGRVKCGKGKNRDQKQKEKRKGKNENENENTTQDNVDSNISKSKTDQKQKEKGKKKESNQMETGESENAEENVDSNISTEEKKRTEKYGKKNEDKGKKEKNKDSYEAKGRKSRKLLTFEQDLRKLLNLDPIEESNPEEQLVITCMQAPLMNELIEEKTRVYEKLEWMLIRVEDKEQQAQTLCIDLQCSNIQLKINAIKTRMSSCAERYMREEL